MSGTSGVKNVSWLATLPSGWQYYRYGMDFDETQYSDRWGTPLRVPANLGREAMAYLTFIIDHYDSLPDYMVFVHGHRKSWHQPMDITWKLKALNLSSLKESGYVNIHCQYDPICDGMMLDLSKGPYLISEDEKLPNCVKPLPAWWKLNFGSPNMATNDLPKEYASMGAAQFAVTKQTIRKHSLEYWQALRKPMESVENLKETDAKLRDISIDMWGLHDQRNRSSLFGTVGHNEYDYYTAGSIFEKSWARVILDKDVWCVSQDRCDHVHFGGAIACEPKQRKLKWKWDCHEDETKMIEMLRYNQAFLKERS